MKKTIGVYGCGFVGGTLVKVLDQMSDVFDVRVFDRDPQRGRNTLEEVAEAELVFVALPTPMILETGECYTGYVKKAVADLRQLNKDNWIVLKSTMTPGTTEELNFSYGKIAFSPEFLTEANAYNDFVDLPYQIIGTVNAPLESGKIAAPFIEARDRDIMKCKDIFFMDATTAEMVKYTRNAYLATRLSFFNEIKQVFDKLNVNYLNVSRFAGFDPRVGDHYNRIDEDNPHFGQHCLPKDLNALIWLANKLGVDPKVSRAVWEKNLEVCGDRERDWEQQVGRAVISLEDKIK